MNSILTQINNKKILVFLFGILFFAAACQPGAGGSGLTQDTPSPLAVANLGLATVSPSPASRPTEEPKLTLTPTEEVQLTPVVIREEEVPRDIARSFTTDFSRHTIPFSEILSGGPPKDGIPAIDSPQFESVAEADIWLEDLEPVTVFQEGEVIRIYPFQILTWHEIVNDVVNGRPVAVTFCPLCNTAIVFDATVDGQALDFGTTGRLRFSNLLMYDRQTESWWQQASGEAVIGQFTGTQLSFLPAAIISWAEAQDSFPEAQVLSRDTGFRRDYGRNPYIGYDNINGSPFLFDGPLPPNQLPAMARVTTVELNGEAVAYPNQVLEEHLVANDTVGDIEVAVFWQPGLASALDSPLISAGKDVGASGVFNRTLDNQTLSFIADGGLIKDVQTGSTWNVLGEAVAGELIGQKLQPLVKVDHFWFSWAAFRPDTRIYQP